MTQDPKLIEREEKPKKDYSCWANEGGVTVRFTETDSGGLRVCIMELGMSPIAATIENYRWKQALSELTAITALEHKLEMAIRALEQYEDVPLYKVAGVSSAGPVDEEYYDEEFTAREALATIKGAKTDE